MFKKGKIMIKKNTTQHCLYRCRKEIERVLKDSQCEASHLPQLSFVHATITEVQRVARVAPMSLLHCTTAPTKVGEFLFPAGSLFSANLSYITHDPEIFSSPEVFNPERWISKDGK